LRKKKKTSDAPWSASETGRGTLTPRAGLETDGPSMRPPPLQSPCPPNPGPATPSTASTARRVSSRPLECGTCGRQQSQAHVRHVREAAEQRRSPHSQSGALASHSAACSCAKHSYHCQTPSTWRRKKTITSALERTDRRSPQYRTVDTGGGAGDQSYRHGVARAAKLRPNPLHRSLSLSRSGRRSTSRNASCTCSICAPPPRENSPCATATAPQAPAP